MDQQKYAEAVKALRESVEEWTLFCGADDERTVSVQRALDEALARFGAPAETMGDDQ